MKSFFSVVEKVLLVSPGPGYFRFTEKTSGCPILATRLISTNFQLACNRKRHSTTLFPGFFKIDQLIFYLQNGCTKDCIDNTMIFRKVESIDQNDHNLTAMNLSENYNGVKLSPIRFRLMHESEYTGGLRIEITHGRDAPVGSDDILRPAVSAETPFCLP